MAYTIQRDSEDYTKIVVGEKAPLLERDKGEASYHSLMFLSGVYIPTQECCTLVVPSIVTPLIDNFSILDEDQNIFSRVCGFFFSDSSDAYVDVLLQANFLLRAIKFFPALLITYV